MLLNHTLSQFDQPAEEAPLVCHFGYSLVPRPTGAMSGKAVERDGEAPSFCTETLRAYSFGVSFSDLHQSRPSLPIRAYQRGADGQVRIEAPGKISPSAAMTIARLATNDIRVPLLGQAALRMQGRGGEDWTVFILRHSIAFYRASTFTSPNKVLSAAHTLGGQVSDIRGFGEFLAYEEETAHGALAQARQISADMADYAAILSHLAALPLVAGEPRRLSYGLV